jgi:hypothetical protein
LSTGIKIVANDFEVTRQKMMDKANSAQGGFARIYKVYQRLQTERFKSENASEGEGWAPLTEKYRTQKTKRFKSYPGSGTKMMIATGTLAGAVIGPGAPFSGTEKHRALFSKTSMTIQIEESGTNAAGKKFDYAGFADEKRPIMEFSEDHLKEMKDELAQFILGF